MGERDSEVGLAAAGLAEEQDRPSGVHEPQGREVIDELAVDGRLELEVEVVDGLAEREPGVAQPGCETPVAGRCCLLRDQTGEKLDVGDVAVAGLFGQRREHFGSAVQLEVAEVVLDLFVDAHAGSRWS